MARQIVVLGGTGFVGRAFAARCAAHGMKWHLRVPTRRLAHGSVLRSLPGLDLVEADVHDPDALARWVGDADAVVNLVAILHGSAGDFQRVHVDLPRTIARVCRAAGVDRLIHVSALGVGPQAPSMYLRSKTDGEVALREAGLAPTVLRPSVVFGDEDRFLNLFASLQALSPFVPLPCASALLQPVWVRDLAQALWCCVERPETAGQVYEVAGPEVFTLRALVRLAGRRAGHVRPVIGLPAALGMAQAWALEHLPGGPLMSRDNLRSMQVPNVATGALPGLADLGITASSIAAAWGNDRAPAVLAEELGRWRAGRGAG
jgi:NADH dehydrogenase